MTIEYNSGRKIKYTGKTEILHGVTWYHFEVLDGIEKGQKAITSRPPKTNTRVWDKNKGFNN